jgi:hypothetical protein
MMGDDPKIRALRMEALAGRQLGHAVAEHRDARQRPGR